MTASPTAPATPITDDSSHPATRVEFRDSDHAYLVRSTCQECSGAGTVPGKREGTTKKCTKCKAEGVRRDRVPAVSTVLSELNKPALVDWAAKMAAEAVAAHVRAMPTNYPTGTYPDPDALADDLHELAIGAHRAVKDEAADTGTAVHDWIETYVVAPDTVELPDDPAVRPACEAFVAWWSTTGFTAVETERIVVDIQLRYAGRFDLLVRDQHGRLWILDIKTSNSVYLEHVLQLSAYAKALRQEVDETIAGTVVVWCHKEGRRVRTIVRDWRQWRADFHIFAALFGVYAHRKALGGELRRLVKESRDEAEAMADVTAFLAS